MTTPHDAMSRALKAAWEYQLLTFPNPAVGAVCIGEQGEILSIGAHKVAGGPHAEVYALRNAYTLLSGDKFLSECDDSQAIHDYLRAHHNGLFKNVQMAVTLEPCAHSGKTPSCALLLRDLGIQHVFIACKDPNPLAANGGKLLEDAGIPCTYGVLEEEGKKLLEPFVIGQKRPYVFFKWAQRLDGTIDKGVISSLGSRTHMHALRDKCDLIVIGGETVRSDRPILDARLVEGRAPDVLIYSTRDDFDPNIPLFSVPNRQVFIESSLDRIANYSLVMIEGGASMMKAVRSMIDGYVCYLAATMGQGTKTMGTNTEEFEVLSARIDQDILLWMKRK